MAEVDLEKDLSTDDNSIRNRGNDINESSTRSSVASLDEPSLLKKIRNLLLNIFRLVAGQWFLLALGMMILLASQVQVPQEHQKTKATAVSYSCVSLIFFLTGCTLKTRTLIDNYSRWKLHIFVQVQCYLITSVVIYAIVSLCATNPNFMDAGLLLGLILTGCTATTISSNVVMTGEAHGNQALTVVQSTLGNFLGPFLTPAIFTMYTSSKAWYTSVLPEEHGGYGEIYRRVFKQLGLSLFVPMVRFYHKFICDDKANKGETGSRSTCAKLSPSYK